MTTGILPSLTSSVKFLEKKEAKCTWYSRREETSAEQVANTKEELSNNVGMVLDDLYLNLLRLG